MTNPQPRPLARDDVPGQEAIRDRIDAADAAAEAHVAAEADVARADDGADGASTGATEADDGAEDVAPDHPAPEPPD